MPEPRASESFVFRGGRALNHLRNAAAAGATIFCLVQRDRATGKPLSQRVNQARRIKAELGLSGRQLKKRRKQLAREQRQEQQRIPHPAAQMPQ